MERTYQVGRVLQKEPITVEREDKYSSIVRIAPWYEAHYETLDDALENAEAMARIELRPIRVFGDWLP